MSHTHFLFHIVFATKDRKPLITAEWESELYAYISGIIKNYGGQTLEINGMPDHLHIATQLDLKIGFPDLMRDVKASSSKWVRRNRLYEFNWQRRYGAFTVSESALDTVRQYIRNQKSHHLSQSFEDEYKSLLRKHRVAFEDEYLST
ncbi:MAG: IS200/IS605 family transposase [Pyrinomonadaceae bacterium]